MNRNDDIRNIMKLVESAGVVTLTEADTSIVDDLADKLVDEIKSQMDKNPDSGYAIIDNMSDLPHQLLAYDDPQWDNLFNAGWPQGGSKEFKFLNDKFKEKFGLGLYKYADKLEDEAHAADQKSIKPADKKIYKILSDKLTVTASPKWAAQNLEFYVMSPKKLVVQDTGSSFPAAVIGAPTLEFLKMDQAAMVQWLLDHGIKQRKRPSNKRRSSYSVYD